jgi:hypothetical protein
VRWKLKDVKYGEIRCFADRVIQITFYQTACKQKTYQSRVYYILVPAVYVLLQMQHIVSIILSECSVCYSETYTYCVCTFHTATDKHKLQCWKDCKNYINLEFQLIVLMIILQKWSNLMTT